MSHPDRNRALRRIAADLAALHADDLGAIIGDLPPGQRQAVERLLRDFENYAKPAPAELKQRVAVDITRLSPWLVERMGEANAPAQVTARVREALQDCVARLYPLPALASQAKPRGRMTGKFVRRGTT